jgi:hypothetical protein
MAKDINKNGNIKGFCYWKRKNTTKKFPSPSED